MHVAPLDEPAMNTPRSSRANEPKPNASVATPRARARYRARRDAGITRANNRKGVHAIAIVVDPSAYQALKLEARRGSISIPSLLGEIVVADLRNPPAVRTVDAPRWRRTGDGRRANQHTRIAIDDGVWEALHADAIQRSLTVGRRTGMAIERWSEGSADAVGA